MFPIVLTTYLDLPDAEREQRLRALNQTIYSHSLHLLRGDLSFIVVHDGKQDTRFETRMPYERHLWTGEHKGVGASLNIGFEVAFSRAPYALYVVDDWELTAAFDMEPWITLLEKNEDIGAVRLGPPHPDLTGMIKHFGEGGWAMRLDRHNFVFSFRPTLFHKRFFEAYGKIPEGVSSFDAEDIYNKHFCETPGPDIFYALPYPWEHIETVELAGITPA